MIPAAKSRPFVAPAPVPILPVVVNIAPEAKQVFSHLPGIQKGSLIYSDLNAYGWYLGKSGFVTINRNHKQQRRTSGGIEDGLNSQK